MRAWTREEEIAAGARIVSEFILILFVLAFVVFGLLTYHPEADSGQPTGRTTTTSTTVGP